MGSPRAASSGPVRSSPADARLGRAYELIASGACEVLSLDVFDTLLWRKVAEPVQLFTLLGDRLRMDRLLAPDVEAGAFGMLRERAERRARRAREESGRGVEVTLREIYDQLPRSCLGDITLDELSLREIELEQSLLVPDLDVVELVRHALEHGRRAVCVSDTYFSELDLRRFLDAAPAGALEIERVFASSAHRVGKGSGLWRIVLDQLAVAPSAVVHVGDNHAADIAAAERAGLAGIYFERRPQRLAKVLLREEIHARAALSPYHGDYGLTALRSKVLHRSEGSGQPPDLRPFWDYGAASLGPPLTGFADWVQERAAAAGASKAFCLMREGKLLSRLVNAAAPAARSAVEAEPIWLSRQVCARASIFEGRPDELSRLFDRQRMPTVAELCSTLGVEPAAVRGFERLAGARLHEPGLAARLTEQLCFDAELRGQIVARSAELRARVIRYLESLRPPGEDRLVLVDLGWGATIQWLLDRLLARAGSDLETTGLYLVTTDRAAERKLDGTDARGFLADLGQPAGQIDAFMRSPEILEQICMPDHGSQIGLDADLQPVLEPVAPLAIQAVERDAVQRGIAAFQREWIRYRTLAPSSLVPLHEHGQDRLRSILVRATAVPTIDEAELFAGWLHDENFGGTGLEPLVSPSSARAARYMDPRSLLESPMNDIYWPFGLAALHDEHLARAVGAAAGGVVSWEGMSTPLETGEVEIFVDRGWGFRRDGMALGRARRNRLGLSYARGTVIGDVVRRVRIDPARGPCVLRLDWIRLRCHRRGADTPVELDFAGPEVVGRLELRGMRTIGAGSFVVPGLDPHIVVDVTELAGPDVHTVDVECGFALLALPTAGLGGFQQRLRQRARERVKRGRLGGPIRAAYSLLRKVD